MPPSTLPAPLSTSLARTFPGVAYTYTERDVALYALGVGCGGGGVAGLRFTYEGDAGFATLPTFACCLPYHGVIADVPLHEIVPNFSPMGVLHGEQYLEIRRPLPPAATVITTPRLVSVQDKGRAAVLVIGAETSVQGEAGVATYQEITVFARGAGGFGEGGGRERPAGATAPADPPAGTSPSTTATAVVPADAALLYRLTGDSNPLHADPEFASLAGFPRPILHGLATLAYAVRAVMDGFAGGDPGAVRTIKGRMSSHVFPGDTLETRMWAVPRRAGTPPSWRRIVFITAARSPGEGEAGRERVVISGGAVEVGPVEESESRRARL